MAKLRWLGNALVFVPSDGSEPDFGESKPAPQRLVGDSREGRAEMARVIQIVKVEGVDKKALNN
jgi:hypothetical protein